MRNVIPYAERLILEYMYKAGMPIHLKGADYICGATKMNLKGTEKLIAVYYYLAKQHNTTEMCIERDIRHCIESAWNKNREAFCRVFGERYSQSRPTNKEFICILSYKVRMRII